MDCQTGKIREYTDEQIDELQKGMGRFKSLMDRGEPMPARKARRAVVEITEDERSFLMTKGTAFRQLWGRKMARGMNERERQLWSTMVEMHVRGRET